MINLSFDELRLIAQIRNISDYENKSKEDLIKALSETKQNQKQNQNCKHQNQNQNHKHQNQNQKCELIRGNLKILEKILMN